MTGVVLDNRDVQGHWHPITKYYIQGNYGVKFMAVQQCLQLRQGGITTEV